MPQTATARDLKEFALYLISCSDAQVRAVYEKETAAGRLAYALLAESEARGRGVTLERV